jgi:hypothetical protein
MCAATPPRIEPNMVFSVVFLAVTYFTFPETRGHSLEELAQIFDGPQVIPDADDVGDEKSKVEYTKHIEERVEVA